MLLLLPCLYCRWRHRRHYKQFVVGSPKKNSASVTIASKQINVDNSFSWRNATILRKFLKRLYGDVVIEYIVRTFCIHNNLSLSHFNEAKFKQLSLSPSWYVLLIAWIFTTQLLKGFFHLTDSKLLNCVLQHMASLRKYFVRSKQVEKTSSVQFFLEQKTSLHLVLKQLRSTLLVKKQLFDCFHSL